jgi:hypothetical protein
VRQLLFDQCYLQRVVVWHAVATQSAVMACVVATDLVTIGSGHLERGAVSNCYQLLTYLLLLLPAIAWFLCLSSAAAAAWRSSNSA